MNSARFQGLRLLSRLMELFGSNARLIQTGMWIMKNLFLRRRRKRKKRRRIWRRKRRKRRRLKSRKRKRGRRVSRRRKKTVKVRTK